MNKEKTPIIQLRDLTTGYRVKKQKKVISQSLNAQLNVGEMVCLLGPNGCGKSTLLRTMVGFQPALSGDILIDRMSLGSFSQKELAKHVSVVLTNNTGIRNMTAEEVVAIGRSPYTGFWGNLREKDRNIVEKCLQWVGITELKGRKMQTLSDGERQKVMIAKAIAQETPIILLDEPTAFLDYPSKVAMMLLLHRLAKALKKTIFLSTHDLEHALQIADQVWLLDKEHGLTTGLPEDLCIEGKIEEYFKRDGIQFDRNTGFFSIEHEVAREVLVEGNPQTLPFKMMCKALRRNAIRPICSMEEAEFGSTRSDVKILVGDDGTYHLMDNNKEAVNVQRIEHIIGLTNATIVKNHIQAVRDAAKMTNFE